MQFFKVQIIDQQIREVFVAAPDQNAAIDKVRDWEANTIDIDELDKSTIDRYTLFLPTKVTKREVTRELL